MSKQLGLIDPRLEGLKLQYQQEFIEEYSVGKGYDTSSRGNQTWVEGTSPVFDSGNVIFTKCDGTTSTLSPIYGGTLYATGDAIILGYCPL